jgi:RNA polymerase sigma-70 factor (ECF subfamily)
MPGKSGENMTSDIDRTIADVLSGNTDAYAAVVRQYQAEIWRIVAFGLHDVSAAEDLVQQVFVKAFMSLDTFDITKDFGVWLRSIARNLLRNEIRRTLRENKTLRSYHEHLVNRLADEAAAQKYDARLRDALARCREGLSPSAKEALALRYEQSLEFGSIAETLGRTLSATRQMLQRIRLGLRRCVEERMVQP